ISDDDDGDLDEDNDEFADDEDVDENENFGEESETEDDDFGDDGDKSDDLDEADDSNESEISDDDDGDLDEVETGDVELGKHEGNMEASQGRGEASAKNEDSGLDGGKVHGEVADAIEEEESFHEENEIAVNRVPTEQKLAEPVLKETKQSFHKIALKSGDLNVTLTFETGRQKMTLGELETIRNGYTFVCENPIEGPVEIRANGTLIGYGQLVDVEGKFGVQITEFTKNVSGL
ncbi:MAG: FliM/FliN family flagellar motor switch protein, partial [Puniceicoccales bacterium]|nr:FliM/FliN family flagellar motor switch protein [Puniceicoccales bacterium]